MLDAGGTVVAVQLAVAVIAVVRRTIGISLNHRRAVLAVEFAVAEIVLDASAVGVDNGGRRPIVAVHRAVAVPVLRFRDVGFVLDDCRAVVTVGDAIATVDLLDDGAVRGEFDDGRAVGAVDLVVTPPLLYG